MMWSINKRIYYQREHIQAINKTSTTLEWISSDELLLPLDEWKGSPKFNKSNLKVESSDISEFIIPHNSKKQKG